MLYVPIKLYPNDRGMKGCVVLAAVYLGLAVAAFINIPDVNMRLVAVLLCMVSFCISIVSLVAVGTKSPMLKVLDDRFSVYTPFGYALVRFGEVLAFRKGGIPGMRTLRVDINNSARPKFPSLVGRLLYALAWMNFTNSVSIQGYMLGAQLDPVIEMLEKRRLAAVRLDAIDEYDPTAVTVTG